MEHLEIPAVSVIVPVYRAEAYLERCVSSILNQSIRNLELILVEDGSPDRSGELCDAFAEQDPRVRVIHQTNAGVSAARNRGLDEAKGTYVGLVDSDDWILEKMYEVLLESAEKTRAEIVMCDTLTVYPEGTTEPDTVLQLPEDRLLKKSDFSPELLLETAGSACRCIYLRKLLEEKKIRFPVGLRFSEDRIFNLYAMGWTSGVSYLKQALYMRFVNSASCVNTFHPDYAEAGKRAARETEKAIGLAWDGADAIKKAYLTQYVDVFFGVLSQLRQGKCGLSYGKRLSEVRKICADPDLRTILRDTGYGDRAGQMVLKKRVLGLMLYEGRLDRKLQNLRELWSTEGIRGVVRKCLKRSNG